MIDRGLQSWAHAGHFWDFSAPWGRRFVVVMLQKQFNLWGCVPGRDEGLGRNMREIFFPLLLPSWRCAGRQKCSQIIWSQRITKDHKCICSFPEPQLPEEHLQRDFSITSGGCSPTSHLCKHKFNHSTATHRPQGFLTRSIPGDWMLRITESFRLETTSEVVECNPALPRPPLTHGPNHEEKEISLLKGQINWSPCVSWAIAFPVRHKSE